MEVVIMIKPKSCPFCGEEPIIRQYADNGFSVTCLNHEWHKSDTCEISIAGDIDICASIDNGVYNYKTEKTEYTQEEIERCKKVAIETWNTRAERTCRNLGGEEGTNYELYDFGCSTCGYCADITEPNYCPYCGAKVID